MIFILKATDDVYNGVHLADVCKELIAKSLSLGGALDKSRDVHEFNGGGGELVGMMHVRQEIQALIGNGDNAYVWLDGAKGVICRFCPRIGQRVKQRAFSDVRKSYDTEFHVYRFSFE